METVLPKSAKMAIIDVKTVKTGKTVKKVSQCLGKMARKPMPTNFLTGF